MRLPAGLAAQAEQRPDAAALITPGGAWTWSEMQARSRAVAKALLAHGVTRGDFVGLLCPNDEHWVACFYGAALIGAVTVPVNTRFKADEIRQCLASADVRLAIAVDRFLNIDFAALLRQAEPALDHRLPGTVLPRLRSLVVIGGDVPAAAQPWSQFLAAGDSIADAVLDRHVARVAPHDLLLIQFTSGTTAFPKGAMLTHDGMLRNAAACAARIGIAPHDVYFNSRPFFHVAGSTLSLLVGLTSGATIATLPTFDAGAALALLHERRCTYISGNDTLFQRLMAHPSFVRERLHLVGGWAAAGPTRCGASSTRWACDASAGPTACRRRRPTSSSTTGATPRRCASGGWRCRTRVSSCASPMRTPAARARRSRWARSRCAAGT